MSADDLDFRARIAAVAADMVAGRTDLLPGCRQIVDLRSRLPKADLTDADLIEVVAVESELDDIPTGPARAHWAPEALAEKDAQAAAYLEKSKAGILRACRALAQKWR
jgi:hypothetical protein